MKSNNGSKKFRDRKSIAAEAGGATTGMGVSKRGGFQVATPKRKIKAKPFVYDLRAGVGDEELMEKYSLSPLQFRKVLGKLVNAGVVDEMEVFMRSSLSDSTISRAFVEDDLSGHDFDHREYSGPSQDVDSKVEVEVTEQAVNTTNGFGKILSRLTGKAL